MSESPAPRVLVVEDDPKTAASVALYLRHAGFGVGLAEDGTRGLELAREGGYDLVLLDLMLPGLSGLEVCRALRRESRTPVILLTARAAEDDRVHGLETGADDYVTKPFSPRELMARVRAVLRRSPAEPGGLPPLRIGELTIDFARHRVLVAGRNAGVTPTELRVLETLARSPQRVFTREELVERALGEEFRGQDRTVDVHVMNLRRKIEPRRGRPRYVQTVFGVGYRFVGVGDAP